ncbi:hypothetical protein V6615_16295 (plasmid) [Oscillospiraceae bacterium PP1C4]
MSKRRKRTLPSAPVAGNTQPMQPLTKEDIKQALLESYVEIEQRKDNEELNHNPTRYLKLLIKFTLYLFGIVMAITAALFLTSVLSTRGSNPLETIFLWLFCGGIIFICIALASIFNLLGKSINKETDKNYLLALFSAALALVALILAIIGLYK